MASLRHGLRPPVAQFMPAWHLHLHQVSLAMAVHLAEEAYMTGAASTYPRPRDLEQHIRGQQYDYTYTAALPPTYPWASLDQ